MTTETTKPTDMRVAPEAEDARDTLGVARKILGILAPLPERQRQKVLTVLTTLIAD